MVKVTENSKALQFASSYPCVMIAAIGTDGLWGPNDPRGIGQVHRSSQGRRKGKLCAVQNFMIFLARQVPFFVNATSGSTVLGAYDDLEALAEVCSKHKVVRLYNSKDSFNL